MAIKTKPLSEVRPDVPTTAAAKGERKQISFSIDKQLHSALKQLALDKDVSLQQVITDFLNQGLKTSKNL